jgi:hypothetical protein
MLHVHFGAGRLGLGLVAPFFEKPSSELYLLNRSRSSANETGSTELSPERKKELLRGNPDHYYGIQTPGEQPGVRDAVRFTEFQGYDDQDVEKIAGQIAEQSAAKRDGVVVTASIVSASNYSPVVRVLNTLANKKHAGAPIGSMFLVPCENTVNAPEVFGDSAVCDLVSPETHRYVKCVPALVDRMCVGLEEYSDGSAGMPRPIVLVRAEEYGSLKLQVQPETEELIDVCSGSRIEFSRYLEVEKEIKGWLLNGTHWLIALTAFETVNGDTGLKLNEFLADPKNRQFAADVLHEMRDGIEIMLLHNPKYADFVREIPPGEYLDGACQAILRRFCSTEDTLARILARFRRPSPNDSTTLEKFVRRFLDRVDPALTAYEQEKGTVPIAANHGLRSLHRLVGSGTFVDTSSSNAA